MVLQKHFWAGFVDICFTMDNQQDNVLKHISKVAKTWLGRKNINVMEWSSQSPSLNPLENLWSIVIQRIDRKNVQHIDEFLNWIKNAWYAISQATINHFIESMSRECKTIIESKY